jgi:hypothetical protein
MRTAIKFAACSLLGLAIAGCISTTTKASTGLYPKGQCKVEGRGSALTSICLQDDIGLSLIKDGGGNTARIAKDSSLFFENSLDKERLISGFNLIEEIISAYSSGQKIGQVEAREMPARVRRLLEKPEFVYVSADGNQMEVTFSGTSDAVIFRRDENGVIAVRYAVY